MRLSKRKTNWLPILEDDRPRDENNMLYLYVPAEVADYVKLVRRPRRGQPDLRTPREVIPALRPAERSAA